MTAKRSLSTVAMLHRTRRLAARVARLERQIAEMQAVGSVERVWLIWLLTCVAGESLTMAAARAMDEAAKKAGKKAGKTAKRPPLNLIHGGKS